MLRCNNKVNHRVLVHFSQGEVYTQTFIRIILQKTFFKVVGLVCFELPAASSSLLSAALKMLPFLSKL